MVRGAKSVDRTKALACLQQGKNEVAMQLFQRVLAQNSKDAESWYYLGILQIRLGRLHEAERSLRKAIRFNPGFGQAFFWLGKVCFYLNRLEAAATAYGKAIKRGFNSIDVWNDLGKVQEQSGMYEAAENSFQKAIHLKPDDGAAYAHLARIEHFQGKYSRTKPLYQKALEINPGDLKAAFGVYLSLPVIYQDKAHLLECRKGYEQGVEQLIAGTDIFLESSGLVNNLLSRDGFYLAYQGMDDKAVQLRFATFYQTLLGYARPQFMQPLQKRRRVGTRLRIGYLSHYFHRHTVSDYFSGWLTEADRSRFEIYVYHLDPVKDEVSRRISAACDVYKPMTGSLSDIASEVRMDQLDILVYPEIGMYPRHLWLGALRLARVQCVAWGHPVTTGLSTMDYFISADATEPELAQEHYAEKLIRVEGLGICYTPPVVPEPGSRRALGLPEDRHIYLCSQSLFKIHIDMDAVFAEIAARDSRAWILFFKDGRPPVDAVFRRRLERAFRSRGLDPDVQACIHERFSYPDYLRLSQLVDVMLDTFHWSGGRTSLDAMACGLATVTLEGRFSRGRQTSGMLRQLGLEEWIAGDVDDYIEKAIQLAMDDNRRQQVSLCMRQPEIAGRLFGVKHAVRSLEQHYRKIAEGS